MVQAFKKLAHQKTPLLVSGVGSFSNSNSFVLDQFITEIKTNFKTSTSPILNSVSN
jgi:hypothetical protein